MAALLSLKPLEVGIARRLKINHRRLVALDVEPVGGAHL